MLISELQIGDAFEVRDSGTLLGTVRMIVHDKRLKIALDFPRRIELRKVTEDLSGRPGHEQAQ